MYASNFIGFGKFRKPSLQPPCFLRTNSRGVVEPSAKSSTIIDFDIDDTPQRVWMADPRTNCSLRYTRSTEPRTPRGRG